MCLPLLEQGHGRCLRYRQPQKAEAGGAGSHRSPPDRDPACLARAWALPAGPLRPARPFPALCRRSNAFSRGHPAHGPFSQVGKAEGPGAASCFTSAGCQAARHPEPRGGPWASELRIRWEGSSSGRKQRGPAACLRVPDRRAWSASSGGTMGGHPGRPGHPRGEAGVKTRGQKPVCGRAAQLCRKGLGGRRCLRTRVAGHAAGVAATQRPAASR